MNIRAYQGIMPVMGENVYVDEMACVIGQVSLGNDSSIWPFAVLRGDVNTITIGARTNIQDHAILHVSHAGPYNRAGRALIIGEDVTVGHQCVLHACTIGDVCLIGIGSILLDDVVVESEVMIGAGSLVPPKKILESGFLYLGRPIQKIRPLTQDELAFLRYSAGHYVEIKNGYRHKGKC